MKQFMTVSLIVLAIACAGGRVALAQKSVEQSGSISKTATIAAIDHKTRVVTLKDNEGNVEDVQCGPEVTRFNELHVGDSVTFAYHAAVVYQIAKPGAAAMSSSTEVSTVKGQGPKPSGAYTHQRKATVTVTAIDPAAPSVTVKTANGHTMVAEVQDKKNLEGLKVGDKVNVTFSEVICCHFSSQLRRHLPRPPLCRPRPPKRIRHSASSPSACQNVTSRQPKSGGKSQFQRSWTKNPPRNTNATPPAIAAGTHQTHFLLMSAPHIVSSS